MAHGNPRLPALPILVAGGFTFGPVFHSITEKALERFKKLGYDVTVVPFSMKDMTDVQAYAMHIAEEVRRVSDVHDGCQVNVIGLSMGGVASLYAIKRLGIAPLVATFTAIAAPFFGSKMSNLAHPTKVLRPLRALGIALDVSKVGRQLEVDSIFLCRLHRLPLPDGPRYVSIAGKHDYVCPAATALLPGTDQRTLDFSHHDIVHSAKLHEEAFSHCI